MVGQLLNVMDYLHRKNILHCDIKTDNIMITNETRNMMLIDFDKAFTASQDLTPGTPLNFGSEDENLTKRQMDIRGVRNIIEKLLQYVDSDILKEKMERVIAKAGSQDVTIPELFEIWKQPILKQNEEKENLKRNSFGRWIGGLILIAMFVIIWLYLPKKGPEVNQPENSIDTEINVITVPGEEKEIYNIEDRKNKEDRKEEKKPATPDWESLLANDVGPMNRLLDTISAEVEAKNINPDSVFYIVLKISDEMNTFNKEVVDKYSSQFPSMSRDKILFAIYDTDIVKSMSLKRDKILECLIEIQETSYKPD